MGKAQKLPPPSISTPGVVVVEGSFGFRKRSLCARDASWLFVLHLSGAAQDLSDKFKGSPSASYSTPGLLLPLDMTILHSGESSPCIIMNDCPGCFGRECESSHEQMELCVTIAQISPR